MAMTVLDIEGTLTLRDNMSKQFTEAVDTVKKGSKEIDDAAKKGGKGLEEMNLKSLILKEGLLGLASALSGGAIVLGLQQLVSTTIEYAQTLSNLNARTGVSLQGLQNLEALGSGANVSM